MIEVTHHAAAADVITGRVVPHAGIDIVRHRSAQLTVLAAGETTGLTMRLPSAWLTPEMQADWLRRLARAADELAVQIEECAPVAA